MTGGFKIGSINNKVCSNQHGLTPINFADATLVQNLSGEAQQFAIGSDDQEEDREETNIVTITHQYQANVKADEKCRWGRGSPKEAGACVPLSFIKTMRAEVARQGWKNAKKKPKPKGPSVGFYANSKALSDTFGSTFSAYVSGMEDDDEEEDHIVAECVVVLNMMSKAIFHDKALIPNSFVEGASVLHQSKRELMNLLSSRGIGKTMAAQRLAEEKLAQEMQLPDNLEDDPRLKPFANCINIFQQPDPDIPGTVVLIHLWFDNVDKMTGNSLHTKISSSHKTAVLLRVVKTTVPLEISQAERWTNGQPIFPRGFHLKVSDSLKTIATNVKTANDEDFTPLRSSVFKDWLSLLINTVSDNDEAVVAETPASDGKATTLRSFELMAREDEPLRTSLAAKGHHHATTTEDVCLIPLALLDLSTKDDSQVAEVVRYIGKRFPNTTFHSSIFLDGDGEIYERLGRVLSNPAYDDIDWAVPVAGDWHLAMHACDLVFRLVGVDIISAVCQELCCTVDDYSGCSFWIRGHHMIVVTWESIVRILLRKYREEFNDDDDDDDDDDDEDQMSMDGEGDYLIIFVIPSFSPSNFMSTLYLPQLSLRSHFRQNLQHLCIV